MANHVQLRPRRTGFDRLEHDSSARISAEKESLQSSERARRRDAGVGEDLLVGVVKTFRSLYITPNIATEVSNLAGTLYGELKRQCFRTFAESIRAAEEIVVTSHEASRSELFMDFGITDAVIDACAGEPPLVLTVDFPLVQMLAARGRPVVNFNHLRYLYW